EGRTGWTVKPGDADALAAALRGALALNAAAREAYARESIVHVRQNFSKAKMCAETLDLYREVVAARAARTAAARQPFNWGKANMKILRIVALGFVASGCAPTATGNDQSVLVNTEWSMSPDKDAFEAANRYCAARGRRAVLISKKSAESEYHFQCAN